MPSHGSFESRWRNVAPLLERALARRGVSQPLLDDVMQETALRLYRSWHRVDPNRPLLPLAVTIAKNVAWDERHRPSQVEVPGDVPDVAMAHDVEELGLARLELERVRAVMDRLSASHRSVLLAEVGGAAEPSLGRDAAKMLRLRARKKMRALLEAAPASVFVARLPRSLWRVFRSTRRPAAALPAPAAIAAACGIVALFGVPHSVPQPQGPGDDSLSPQVAVAGPSPSSSARISAGRGEPRDKRTRTAARPQGRDRIDPSDPAGGAYWQVGVGDADGPVEGDAGVSISTEPNNEVSPPQCTVDNSESHEVSAACRADLGDRQVSVGTSIEVRP